MKEISLTRGFVAIIDDEDYGIVSQHKWHVQPNRNTLYALTNVYMSNGNQTSLRMHRLITNAPGNMQVDHINGDGLDNRKENLRICTNTENQRNMHSGRGKSKYKGVSRDPRGKKWRAMIMVNGKLLQLGRFVSETEAALAYDVAARAHFGEFANINNVSQKENTIG